MRQLLQHLGSGVTLLAEGPAPTLRPGHLLIRSQVSLVSIGTERMLIDFGKASWIDKARQQPEKLKLVLEKIRTDGLFPTLQAVQAKLDQPIALGYCNAGVVLEVDPGITEFRVGDTVVSSGPHAEIVCVPKNLCARLPEGVTCEEAPFAVLGAVGLQGIRLLQPMLGEAVAVTGLGLIGLLCVQMLRANGCRVLGIDFDSAKCALARGFGAETVDLSKGEDPVAAAQLFSRNRGMDGVLITASTQSNEPVRQAALMSRKRGRIVLVGVTGLELSRADFYEKELSFQVSCSYGPGRYDPEYEMKGHDYPIGYVRWTEQRNFEAVLQLLAEGRINCQPLITHRIEFAKGLRAYETETLGKALGILLDYRAVTSEARPANNTDDNRLARSIALSTPPVATTTDITVGVIGAGNFTGQVLLPALKRTGVRLRSIASTSGVSAAQLGRKFGFEAATSDAGTILADDAIHAVIIATRHGTHAPFVLHALRAGKSVFVEKPLCITRDELGEIVRLHNESLRTPSESTPMRFPPPFLMVGFNRRFAPQIVRMKGLLDAAKEPKALVVTINAGAIPPQHWTQSKAEGGGRIVGEACHFVDLLRFLVGQKIVALQARQAGTGATSHPGDRVTFTLSFADGSLGTVHYFANGHRSFPKERLEVFCAGRVLQLDNFRHMVGFGWPGFRKMNLWRQDKGHAAEMSALVESVKKGGPSPIPFEEIVEVTEATFAIEEAAQRECGSPARTTF